MEGSGTSQEYRKQWTLFRWTKAISIVFPCSWGEANELPGMGTTFVRIIPRSDCSRSTREVKKRSDLPNHESFLQLLRKLEPSGVRQQSYPTVQPLKSRIDAITHDRDRTRNRTGSRFIFGHDGWLGLEPSEISMPPNFGSTGIGTKLDCQRKNCSCPN